jgi:hypothetical protein
MLVPVKLTHARRWISSMDKHLARTALVLKKRGVDNAAAARYQAEKYKVTKSQASGSSGIQGGVSGRSTVIHGGAGSRADEMEFGAGMSANMMAEKRIAAAMARGEFDSPSDSVKAAVARTIGADGSAPQTSGDATERVLANAGAAPRSFMLSRDIKAQRAELAASVASAKASGESATSARSSMRGTKLRGDHAKLDEKIRLYNDAVLSDSLQHQGTSFPMRQLPRLDPVDDLIRSLDE